MENSRLLFLDSFQWYFPLKKKTVQCKKNRTVCLNQRNARKYNRGQKLANRAQSSCDKAPEKSCWLPAVVRLRRLLLKLWTSFYDRKSCCFGLVSCLGYLVNLYVQLPRTSTCMNKKNKIKKRWINTSVDYIGGRPFDQFHYSCTCFVVFHVPERKFDAIAISLGLCYRLITQTKK